jgi:hypothetical protein
MDIIVDDLQLCDDCLFVAVNGDYSGIDEHYGKGLSPGRGGLREGAVERAAEVDAGLARLGPNLVPHFDSETGEGIDEFSARRCSCCGTWAAGGRHRFAILGKHDPGCSGDCDLMPGGKLACETPISEV